MLFPSQLPQGYSQQPSWQSRLRYFVECLHRKKKTEVLVFYLRNLELRKRLEEAMSIIG